jgi:hypothetical protein
VAFGFIPVREKIILNGLGEMRVLNSDCRRDLFGAVFGWHQFGCSSGDSLRKANAMMKKSMEVISEAVRDNTHPFRKTDHQPKKALKNRYERRKIKELLHLGDWLSEEAV